LEGAVERFCNSALDLVIADLGIVGPNGYRRVEAVRRETGYMDVPMMFLSETQGPGVIHRHGGAGGAYFLRKPLDVVVLLELVDKALWSHRLAALSR
jgi:CheY-like chemotaxis protein